MSLRMITEEFSIKMAKQVNRKYHYFKRSNKELRLWQKKQKKQRT